MGNHLFVIFAVLDVSLAVNLCINCSFFTFITKIKRHVLGHCYCVCRTWFIVAVDYVPFTRHRRRQFLV